MIRRLSQLQIKQVLISTASIFKDLYDFDVGSVRHNNGTALHANFGTWHQKISLVSSAGIRDIVRCGVVNGIVLNHMITCTIAMVTYLEKVINCRSRKNPLLFQPNVRLGSLAWIHINRSIKNLHVVSLTHVPMRPNSKCLALIMAASFLQ